MKYIMEIVKELFRKIKNNHIDEYTAQCAYFTILAFIPLIMLIMTLTKYVGIEQSTLFFILEKIFSNNTLNNAIFGIIKEVYSKSVGTITISAIFVLWSAGNGFFVLCKGLNAAYEVKQNKVIHSRIKALLLTLIFIFFTVISLIVLVFGNMINKILQEKFNIFNNTFIILLKSKTILSIIVLFVIFIMMYKFIPNHKYKLKYQIVGALFASVACNLLSIFYSLYVNIFNGFSVMYGSLTTIVLAMMWVYACMYSILLGAIINKIISEKLSKKEDEKIK